MKRPLIEEFQELGAVVFDAKVKDYGESLEVDNIWNRNKIREWMASVAPMHHLLAANRKEFRTLFGKPSFYFKSEFYFHCWAIDMGDAQILILTALNKGTCYEAIVKRDGEKVRCDEDLIIKFLELLTLKLEEMDNGV